MSTDRTVVHKGWTTTTQQPEAKRPLPTTTREGKERRVETEPMVLDCSSEGVTENQWRQIEAWIRQTVPVPGHRLQVLISICTCRQQWGKPLELRLEDEKSSFSPDQRSRVSLRHHNHDDQPVRLEITLRQIVRPA